MEDSSFGRIFRSIVNIPMGQSCIGKCAIEPARPGSLCLAFAASNVRKITSWIVLSSTIDYCTICTRLKTTVESHFLLSLTAAGAEEVLLLIHAVHNFLCIGSDIAGNLLCSA